MNSRHTMTSPHSQPEYQPDPQLQSLLDELLCPPGDTAHLEASILTATRKRLGRPTVLARIHPALWACAAAIVLALGLALWVSLLPAPSQTSPIIVADLGTQLAQVAAADEPRLTPLDEQLDLLALQVELAASRPMWANGSDNLDDVVMQYELDNLATESAWMF
jgi:hypothetical protein